MLRYPPTPCTPVVHIWLNACQHMAGIKGSSGHHILTRDDRTLEQYNGAVIDAIDMLVSGGIKDLSVELPAGEDVRLWGLIEGELKSAYRHDLIRNVYFSQYGTEWRKDWNVGEIVNDSSYEAHKARLGVNDITFTPTYGCPANGANSLIHQLISEHSLNSETVLWIEIKHTTLDTLKRIIATEITRFDARYLTKNVRFFTVGASQ